MRFKNTVVLVTGASRGIGKAIALEFAKEGADVVVNYIKSGDQANLVVKEIEKLGSKAIAIKCDISDEDEVRKMIDTTVKTFGRLDVLVNNAGIVFDVPFSKRTLEQWRKTFDVNMAGMFLCCKYAAVPMLKQKSGKIVNISSTNGINSYHPDSIDYSATKAAVINFTKSLAWELGPHILVNCVAPGWVNTEMNKNLPKDYVEEELKRQVIRRFSDPEEQAKAVLFLASDDASYITGAILTVDGGYK
jgi:3-oxoacyl-[acyl-carrier protein] reductase